jgi:hypothetical protein
MVYGAAIKKTQPLGGRILQELCWKLPGRFPEVCPGSSTGKGKSNQLLFPAESRFHGKTALKRFHLSIDDITKLVDAGKEKGYLTYNEVNDLIPHDIHSPEDLDDLLTTIGTRGIDVLEGQPKLRFSAFGKKLDKEVEGGSEVELDPTGGALEKTNDPVRIYLREMGAVPLLTREAEVDIAKRIEHGQMRTWKALSRSPIVIRQVLTIGEDLRRGVRSIKETVVFDEEEITEEILQNRVEEVTRRIDELQDRADVAHHWQVRFHKLRVPTPDRSSE